MIQGYVWGTEGTEERKDFVGQAVSCLTGRTLFAYEICVEPNGLTSLWLVFGSRAM